MKWSKEWLHDEAKRAGISVAGVRSRLSHGKKNIDPGPGEITFKEWRLSEAQRIGATPGAVEKRFYRGKYPNLERRQVNQRVVFVTVK
jgi:hypothetical protein